MYFPFQSQGYLKPLADWWLILTVDPEIIRYYCKLAQYWGIDIEMGSRHGPHISVVQGTKPKIVKPWFSLKRRLIEFEYSNSFRHNNYHCWLDVKSRSLEKIRKGLGLRPKPYHSFHLTLGRLKYNIDHALHEPRPKNIKKKLRKPNKKSLY